MYWLVQMEMFAIILELNENKESEFQSYELEADYYRTKYGHRKVNDSLDKYEKI